MRQQVKGWDIDGVLADFTNHFYEWLGQPKPSENEFEEWDVPFIRDNFHEIKDNERFWLTIPKMKSIEPSRMNVDLYITARPIPSEITALWLKRNNFPKRQVFTSGYMGSKKQIALQTGVTHFIDDHHQNCLDLQEIGVVTCLVKPPYMNYKQFDVCFESLAHNELHPFYNSKF